MPKLSLPDGRLHYEIGGSGPPLLLIAGMLSDSASWGPLVTPLEESHTVIRPDNRTTGRTQHDGQARIEDMASDAARLVNALGLGPAHVVGHSLGGTIALLLAGIRPQAVRSLTLMAAAPLNRPHLVALFEGLARIRARTEEEWLRALYPWLFSPAFFETPSNVEAALLAARAYPHAQSLPAMEEQTRAFAAFDPGTIRPVGAIPAQAIFGATDLIAPQALAEPVLRALGVETFGCLPDAGHSLHWDAPEATLAAITRWLESLA